MQQIVNDNARFVNYISHIGGDNSGTRKNFIFKNNKLARNILKNLKSLKPFYVKLRLHNIRKLALKFWRKR